MAFIPGTNTRIPGTGTPSGLSTSTTREKINLGAISSEGGTGGGAEGGTGGGAGGGTGGATTIGSPVNFNAESYLYDVGLQNIFQDYQKSIATLNQQEQQSLQDAYYIREMSKKYLGEYASNVGVGDVSGNLLDIYGQYQQAVSGVRSQTDMAELGLQQQYDAQKRQLEMGKIATDAQGAQNPIANWTSISSQNAVDLDGMPIPNQNYNPEFNLEYYIDKPSGWKDGISEVFVDNQGNQKYISLTIDEEGAKEGSFKGDSKFDIEDAFETQYPGKTATAGDTVLFKGETFVLKGGSWYRLQGFGANSPTSVIQNMQRQSRSYSEDTLITNVNNISQAGPGLYQDDKNKNLYIVNLEKATGSAGSAYLVRTDSDSSFSVTGADDNRSTAIVAKFREVHAKEDGSIKNTSVVEYQGKLYFHKDGKIYEMKKRTYSR
jgi:hypothetical protein